METSYQRSERSRENRVFDGILETVGNTALVRLRRYLQDRPGVELYAKLEALNPGGSIKDRPARAILEDALAKGDVLPGAVVIESSSGNMGVGLAQACLYHGLRFICVVDAKTARLNLRVLRAYGAEIEMVREPDPNSGELLQARLQRVRDLLDRHPGSFWPNQYTNWNNPRSHQATTMSEVVEELDGRVDYLLAATSTCGTVRGCGEYVRDHGLDTRIVAVDARGSLIFCHQSQERRIPGLGASIQPELCEPDLIDEVILVDDADCVVGCRRLVRREAILAGGSSGGVMMAVESIASRLRDGDRLVAILPDRGERYLDTVYDDEWVRRELGADVLERFPDRMSDDGAAAVRVAL